nr:cytoplasmic protein [Cryptococcus depauperatus CBS 7841]
MQAFRNFQAQMPALPTVDVSAVSKGFRHTLQATKERMGNVGPDGITELPAEYRQLEARVDALRDVHNKLLKITKLWQYDYPADVTEGLSEVGHQAASAWSAFANKNLKGTNLPIPIPSPTAPAPHQPKTLAHALSRAAKSGATELGDTDRLGVSLGIYGAALEKVGDARISQDQLIAERFVTPWQATLSTSIGLAIKARQNVKASRLELDSARAALKSAAPTKQEQARLHVEEAEDKLVQNIETAIGLMKAVLENASPEPLQNLSNLVKAQLIFHSTAAETLSGIQGQIEEAATAAEGEYRQSRGT